MFRVDIQQCIIQPMGTQINDHSNDLLLSDIFTRAVRYWWLVTLLVIAGGVLGLSVSLLQKPLYESNSQLTTVIDFAYAGRLTDYEEDYLLSAIGDIITSDDVINKTAAAAVNQGLLADPSDVIRGLESFRQGYRWRLSSRFHDARVSQMVNQLWLDTSLYALEDFRQQSLNALAQVNAQAEVEACFQQAVSLEPVAPYCSLEEMRALLTSLDGSNASGQPGSLLTRLLTSRISFQVTKEAYLPSKPVHYSMNTTVLAGAIAGLLVGLILFLLGFPRSRIAGSRK